MDKGDTVWVNDKYYSSVPKSFDRVGTVIAIRDDVVAVRLDLLKVRRDAEVIHLIPRIYLAQRVDRSI